MSTLEVTKLRKSYPAFTLNEVSFCPREGKITGFIGRNGAGKSTTLKCLFDLVHPDGGEVRFFDKPYRGNEIAIKQRVGFVPGGIDYYPQKKLSVITGVTRSFYEHWDDAAYARYLKQFELNEQKKPSELSAGMRVKYALALALSHRADLLILDEPTSGLDPVSREELLEVFLELSDEGKTILFSTHITSDLDKCADDILYLRDGDLVADMPLGDFAAMYRSVHFTEATDQQRALLIGARRAKEGMTALVRTQDADRLGMPSQEADLDTIMVHLEKETEQ